MDINNYFQHQEYLILRDWIKEEDLNWCALSQNPNAISIIEKNLDKVIWEDLSMNTNAIHILEKNLDKVNWDYLSANPSAIHILENNLDKVDIDYVLTYNINAYDFLKNHLDMVPDIAYFSCLSENQSPTAVKLLENYFEEIYWYELSANPYAVHILKNNLDKVNWYMLSQNPSAINIIEKNMDNIFWYGLSQNPNAIHIIEKDLDNLHKQGKLDWSALSKNRGAISILEKNIDKINKRELSINPNAIHLIKKILDDGGCGRIDCNNGACDINECEMRSNYLLDFYEIELNPSIFTYDYKKIKEDHKELNVELVEYLHRPCFIEKYIEAGNNIEDYLN